MTDEERQMLLKLNRLVLGEDGQPGIFHKVNSMWDTNIRGALIERWGIVIATAILVAVIGRALG